MLKFDCNFLPSGPILVFCLSIFRMSSLEEIDDTQASTSQIPSFQNSEERWSYLRKYLKSETNSTTVSEELHHNLTQVSTTEKSRPLPSKYFTTEATPAIQTRIYYQQGDAAAVLRNKKLFESKTGIDLNDEKMWEPEGPIFTDDFFDDDTWSTSNPLYENIDRMKRDASSHNVSDDDDDISWLLYQSKESEEMQKWLETSTMSASQEKQYQYYATKNFSSHSNHSSIESIHPDVYTDSDESSPKSENGTFTSSEEETLTTENSSTMTYRTYAWPTPPSSLSDSQESWYAGFEERVKTTLSMEMFRPGDPTWWRSWSSTRKEDFTWTSYPPYHPHNATTARTNDSWLHLYRFPSMEAYQNYVYYKLHPNETHDVIKDHPPVDHQPKNYSTSTTLQPSRKRHHDGSDEESSYERKDYSFPNVHLTPVEEPWKLTATKAKRSFWRGRGKPPKPWMKRTPPPKFRRKSNEEDFRKEEPENEDDQNQSENKDSSISEEFTKAGKYYRGKPRKSPKKRKDIKPRRKFDERRKGGRFK